MTRVNGPSRLATTRDRAGNSDEENAGSLLVMRARASGADGPKVSSASSSTSLSAAGSSR